MLGFIESFFLVNQLNPNLQYLYRFGGVVLHCNRAVEGLEKISSGSPEFWSIQFDASAQNLIPTSRFVEVWRDANDFLCVLQVESKYIVRFEGLADFTIDLISQSIEVYSSLECSVETVNHLLLDQVLPRVLAHCGGMILHAAGVVIDDQAVAFLGETGHGKSTLANSYMQAGNFLLTDDALLVEPNSRRSTARAMYPCIRLWPETLEGLYGENAQTAPMAHYSAKQRVLFDPSSRVTTESHPLGAAFVLNGIDKAGPAEITQIGQQAACIELIKNSFQLSPGDPIIAARMFEQAVALTAAVPIYQLTYPRGFEYIAQTREIIGQQLKDLVR